MTAGIATRVQIAAPFIWLGMVLAISFLETSLKFRAPGITVALGLGIGRLVFRAFYSVELVLAVALTAAMFADQAGVSGRGVPGALIALWAVLVGQVAVLRLRLERRTRHILAGQNPPRSYLHLAYITLEAAKAVLLAVFGALLIARVAA